MRLAFLLALTLVTGCASANRVATREMEKRYVTTYYDRNHDGVVDF